MSNLAGMSFARCISNSFCGFSKTRLDICRTAACSTGRGYGLGTDLRHASSERHFFVEVEIRGSSTSNEPRSTAESQVLNCPLHENQQTILESNDVHQMYEDPNDPGNEAGKLNTKDVSHCGCAPDDRQGAFIEVFE